MWRLSRTDFRELRADAAVFGPDRKLARQVFAAEAKPDAMVDTRVKQVIARLDSDDVHERDSAATDLATMGIRRRSVWRG